MIRPRNRSWKLAVTIGLFLLFVMALPYAQAQEEEGVAPRLEITGESAGSLPAVALQAYGVDESGALMPFAPADLRISHNGRDVGQPDTVRPQQVGTFTVFLIDIPEGVADQLTAVQDAILQYAAAPHMEEQVDAIAVYQVGEETAVQLLAPDKFHNSVRNLFAEPLTPESGTTALNDSVHSLLADIDALKPNADMAAALVVISDGTDAVSSRNLDDVTAQAARIGIPVHSIWLDNADLPQSFKEQGQDNLLEWANGSGGFSFHLDDPAGLSAIWERISSFRDQFRVTYIVEDPTGGEAAVILSLAEDPTVLARTAVEIPANAPVLNINLPAESRELTLPNVEEAVELKFMVDVAWLDGEEHAVEAAQLIVNGTPQEIPADSVADFTTDVENLIFGANRLHVAILDDLGAQAVSPEIVLTVNEGRTSIPDELKPSSALGSLFRMLFWLLLLVVVIGAILFVWKQGLLDNLRLKRSPRRRPEVRITDPAPDPIAPPSPAEEERAAPPEAAYDPGYPPPHAIAYLEVLSSESDAPAEYALHGDVIRIGRSPAQADIIFESDLTVSRLHAVMELEDAHYRLFNQSTTSGSWVNDQQVPEYGIQLMNGDEIHLGGVHLRFRQG